MYPDMGTGRPLGAIVTRRAGGYVCLHPDEREQVAGELLASEAGCIVRREGSLSVFAPNQTAVDALFETAISTHEPLS